MYLCDRSQRVWSPMTIVGERRDDKQKSGRERVHGWDQNTVKFKRSTAEMPKLRPGACA